LFYSHHTTYSNLCVCFLHYEQNLHLINTYFQNFDWGLAVAYAIMRRRCCYAAANL